MNQRKFAVISFGFVSIFSAFLLYIIKEKGKVCKCKNRVKNKVVAITGGSSGIGYAAAIQLASLGAIVYLGCRNEELGESTAYKIRRKTKNYQVYCIPFDLCNLESCNKFVQVLLQREPKLDILIHCAGVFHSNPVLTVDGFELLCQTNFLGPIAVTERVLPLLFDSSSSRVIFVNSEAHLKPSLQDVASLDFRRIPPLVTFDDHVKHYGVTKLALKLYAGFLADESKNLPFTTTSINPGNVWTGIYRSCWNRWYEWPMRFLCSLLMKTPEEGCQSIIHAANVKNLRNGSYISDCDEVFPFLTSSEFEVGKKLVLKAFDELDIK